MSCLLKHSFRSKRYLCVVVLCLVCTNLFQRMCNLHLLLSTPFLKPINALATWVKCLLHEYVEAALYVTSEFCQINKRDTLHDVGDAVLCLIVA